MVRLRSLDSLFSTPTMRSNTCGGGPSTDSKVTVGPPPAMAKALPAAWELLMAPPPAQPPRPQANAISVAAITARAGTPPGRNKDNDAPHITHAISLKCINV